MTADILAEEFSKRTKAFRAFEKIDGFLDGYFERSCALDKDALKLLLADCELCADLRHCPGFVRMVYQKLVDLGDNLENAVDLVVELDRYLFQVLRQS